MTLPSELPLTADRPPGYPSLLSLVSTVRRVPSVRAGGAWDALVPDNWIMDEWRGGGCAAIVTYLDVEGVVWEVVLMPDGDLNLPRPDHSGTVWTIMANHYSEEDNGEWVLGTTYELGPPDASRTHRHLHELNLPPYREGDTFPTGRVLAWVHDLVVSGETTLV